jgi:hypothetical protein
MPLILSKAAFAARHGRGASTISNWIARGKLSGAALTADSRINVEEAERQLGLTLDQSRSEGALAAATERRLIEDQPRGSDKAAADPTTREQLLEVELTRKRRQLRLEQGIYVLAEQVRKERRQALAQMIAAIDNWIPELVAILGLGREELVRAKAEWRHFRQRQEEQTTADAEALPEYLPDPSMTREALAHAA